MNAAKSAREWTKWYLSKNLIDLDPKTLFCPPIFVRSKISILRPPWSSGPELLACSEISNFPVLGRCEHLMTDFRNDHIRYIWCDSESVDYLPVILPVLILDNDQSFLNFTDFWIDIKRMIWNHLRFWKLFNLNRTIIGATH